MSLLRQRIMESALHFIAEKGYASTSIHEIANDCAIAKGTFYKYFASKEDLLIEVFDAKFQRMRQHADLIRSDVKLTPRERLIQESRLQLDFFTEFKFNIQLVHELPIQESDKFGAYAFVLRAKLMSYYSECLLRAYGTDIDPYKWDLVTLFVGMMKQYTMFGYLVNSPVDLERISIYIVDRMDEITAGILKKKPEPLFDVSAVEQFVGFSQEGQNVPAKQLKADLLQHLAEAVRELAAPSFRKAELLEAIELIQDQSDEAAPKPVLIRSLLSFLATQHELISYTGQLERIIAYEKRTAK